eukprot:GHVO01020624.1.p1 GENE.GHVO01020624.1~~GHVO01020624.1.p1  ORF type:complete len:130 (-),score=7.89 GHVO01020624.1:176-565(-)
MAQFWLRYGLRRKVYTHQDMLMYHVVAPKLVHPGLLRDKEIISMPTRMNRVEIRIRSDNSTKEISINESVRVVEIVKCRRGYIYKIDGLLYPRWNTGPNLFDFIRNTPVTLLLQSLVLFSVAEHHQIIL